MVLRFLVLVFIRNRVISRLKFRNRIGVFIYTKDLYYPTGQRIDGDCCFQHASFAKDHIKALNTPNSVGMFPFSQYEL